MPDAIQIVIGTAVEGDQGFVGEVERVDVDPTGNFAVRVAVRPRHEGGSARLVPMEVLDVGPHGLRLHRSLDEFEEFPPADGPGR